MNVFGQALRQKQEDVQSSAATHRLALAAFALQQALDDGRPIVRELMELKVLPATF